MDPLKLERQKRIYVKNPKTDLQVTKSDRKKVLQEHYEQEVVIVPVPVVRTAEPMQDTEYIGWNEANV